MADNARDSRVGVIGESAVGLLGQHTRADAIAGQLKRVAGAQIKPGQVRPRRPGGIRLCLG
jgi:hypothetical protein